jgi:RHS repeat-associated protein
MDAMWGSSENEYVYGAAFDGEGAIYVAGTTDGSFGGQTNQGNGDFFISKYDTNGDAVWDRIFGTSGEQMFYDNTGECLAADPCGNPFITGSTGPAGGLYDYFIAKYDKNGSEEWRDWGGATTNSTFGFTVSVDKGGDAYVAGTTYGGFDSQPFSGTQGQNFLLKYDADGPWQWTRLWGSDVADFGIGSCVSTSGDIFVSGTTRGSIDGQPYVANNDIYVSKWSDTVDAFPFEVISIAPKPGKQFIPTGTTLTKSDFNIVVDPPACVGPVSVLPLYFPTAGVYQVVASSGSSAATTTVTALQPDSILNVDNPEDIPSVPMTNGTPVYTTTLSRISFEQLVMMANAQGSPLDPVYDFDWSDWTNALEVAKKAKSRGILDVFQGFDWADIKARVFDPVNVVQGNFYADETDLRLSAPDALEIRRSYSSENLAPSDLSAGWHLSRNYFLFVNNPVFDLATNAALPTNAEVRVSEPDGTAVVYSRNASTPANVLLLNASAAASDSNAPLNNVNANGIGARANLMNNRVEYVPSNRSFNVYNGQGSVRRFDWQEFSATNDPAYRKRPYLVYEQRPNGNRIGFTYTTNGQPSTIRATDNAGTTVFNTVSFQYNADNKLWRLTASEGRTVSYYYDDLGDLSRVVRPDGTEVLYGYEHFPISGTPTNYSSHRITRVQKPDSRILENEYFQIGETVGGEVLTNGHYLIGRVKLQKVTQVSPSTLITNAWFSYSVVTNSGDPAAGSGFTEVYDALKNKTVYRFDTNRHITAIERYAKARDANGNPIMDGTNFTYTLFSTERRYWNGVNLVRTALETVSSNVVFNWGATYDDRGNLLSEKIAGNLSGNFSGTLQFDTNGLPSNGESASTLYTYTYNAANTNDAQNLMTSIGRPNGSALRFVYASVSNSSLTARYFCQPDGDTNAFNNAIYSREFYEYDANQVLTKRITDDGTASNKTDLTGVAQRRINEATPGTAAPTYGLPVTVYDKFYNGSSDQTLLRHDLRYDARGNPTNVLTYNSTNGLQFSTAFGYDPMNRQTLAVDANGGQTAYTYDGNGNLTTIDGPLTNLTDTSTFSFDYANRLVSTVRRDGFGNVLTNTFAYDEFGNETARTNLRGQVTRSYYDDLHRRTAIVLPNIVTAESNSVAPTILSGFDMFDNIAALVDANSNQTSYAYNARKQRIAAYYPDDTQETFTYDTAGRLVESVAPNGSYTVYQYDLLDRVTNRLIYAQDSMLLARYSTAYNAFNMTAQTDANTNTTSFASDWAGRLIYEYGPGATATRAQTQYLYNDLSQVSERRTWFGANATDYTATVYAYDNLGRVVSETVRDSGATVLLKTEYGYDVAGNRTLVRAFPTAASGGATTLSEYDALNNLVTVTDALTNRTTIAYDYSGSGLKTTVTDPLTNKTVTILDALGRETTVESRSATNGLLRLTEYRHDPNGNQTRAIETVIGSNHTITAGWTYDIRNRALTMTEALGSADERTTRYFYNEVGQLYSQKNPNGVEFFHFYDPRGRVENLISGDNSIRYRYTYDANNNVLSVQDIVTGQTTTREYDENNRVKKETQATGFVLEYAYDRAGRETRALLPGSNAVDYAYNAAFLTVVRRMTSVASLGTAGSLAYQHSYTSNDLAGNILGVTLASGQAQTFQTDRLNRRTLISGPAWTQTVSSGTSGYDPAGNLKNFTVNDPGSTLNFVHTYDGLYQLASEAGVVSRAYAHDSIGNRLSLNGGATAYTYNDLNELLLQNASTNVLTGTIRVPVSGLYGPTKLSEAVSSVTLKLDGGSALSATLTNGTWEYADGGLKGLNVPVDGANHTIAATATTTNSLTNAKTVSVSYASTTITGYRFDRNGNLVQQIAHGSNAVVWSYTYDALNRMVTATKACPTCEPLSVRFAYDPFNRRISKTIFSGSTTSLIQRFLWDRQSEIGAFNVSNNAMQLRVLGRGLGNEVGAAVAVELRTNAASALVVYVPIHDHRGNVVVLLNRAAGTVAEYYRYDAFGNVRIYSPAGVWLADSVIGNPWRVASKRADEETGFVYFGRRLYDPMIGRFVTADPLGFADGPNRYAYVGNRPLVFIDADGRLAKGAGYGLKDLAVGTGQLFWNLGGSLGYGAVSIFDYELAEAIYGNQAQGLRNFGYGMGGLAWNVGGGIGYAVTWGIDPEYARNVYGEQTAGLQEAAIAMSGGEGQSGAFRTGYVGSQIAAVYLLGKYGNQPIGAKSVPSNWNPLNGPGPIGEEAAATFRSASYTETVTSEATTLYRVYGGKAGELASYWTRIPPAGPLQAMIDSALNPAWGNTAQNVATIRVPAGTTIYEGFAAPQGGLLGGGSQVYIPKVNPDWLAYP